MSTRDALALGLIALGLLQLAGDGLERTGAETAGRAIKGVAAATCASPAPKVFSIARGLETYSTRFFFEWDEQGGVRRSVELSSEIYARMRGPYNRRNAYGAALAYGPVLAASPATSPMIAAILDHALAGDASLLAELGIDASARTGPVRVRYEPRAGADIQGLPLEIGPERR